MASSRCTAFPGCTVCCRTRHSMWEVWLMSRSESTKDMCMKCTSSFLRHGISIHHHSSPIITLSLPLLPLFPQNCESSRDSTHWNRIAHSHRPFRLSNSLSNGLHSNCRAQWSFPLHGNNFAQWQSNVWTHHTTIHGTGTKIVLSSVVILNQWIPTVSYKHPCRLHTRPITTYAGVHSAKSISLPCAKWFSLD